MYIETNTTELNVLNGASDTAELKFTKDFGAIRMTMRSDEAPDADKNAPTIADIDQILVELPGRGGKSRRINLSGNEVHMAGLIAGLGSSNGQEAAMSSSYAMIQVGDTSSAIDTFSYIDLPVGAAAGEEVRITVKVASGFATGTGVVFKFSALTQVANRNLIFDVSSLGTGTRTDHTFRSDIEPIAVVVGAASAAYTFAPMDAVGNSFNQITEINFDGLPQFTYDDTSATAVELDKLITSSSVALGRDAANAGLAFSEVPDGTRKLNVETSASLAAWVVVMYQDGEA